jgi:UDP-glucose 4-epimerase
MILLTGASGFIGSNILSELIRNYGKENIVVLSSIEIPGINCLLHHQYTFTSDFFVENGFGAIDTIIHAGAFIPKKNSDSNNIVSCNSSIFSAEKIIESNLPKLKKFILLSTIDVYDAKGVINEDSIINPSSLYGFSKLYTEKIVEFSCKAKFVDFQILRIGHVYGPGEEKYHKIIPLCISKILNNEPIQIFGRGDRLRSFIYIDDVVRAIINSISIGKTNEVINIVGGVSISIYDLIQLIAKVSKFNPIIEFLPELGNDRDLIFDNSKMVNLLNIKEVSLSNGLDQEIFYMRNLK